MTIDLLVTKKNENFKLSDLGLEVKDIDESSPSLDVSYRTVTNRSGRTRSNSRYGVKTIKVVGGFYTDSLFDYEELKDEINGRLVSKEPYYITKMLPVIEGLYEFELPGESTDDIDLLDLEHEAYKYRYYVVMANHHIDFRGRSNKGLFFEFEMNFETEVLPFGETESRTGNIENHQPGVEWQKVANPTLTRICGIEYNGTAENSQLESPWFIRLTATQNQKGDFFFKVGSREFIHTSLTQIQTGDIFELRGVETRLNDSNINNYTNYEHFILIQGNNRIETDFIGTIEVVGLKDFYK